MAMAVNDTILSFVGFHASLLREDCTPRAEARGRAALRSARGDPQVEPPGNAVFIFGSVEEITCRQQRHKLRPIIGGIETVRLRPLGVGQEDGRRRIVLERGKKLVPNRILGKDKREPLDMRRSLSHSSARHSQERPYAAGAQTRGPARGRWQRGQLRQLMSLGWTC